MSCYAILLDKNELFYKATIFPGEKACSSAIIKFETYELGIKIRKELQLDIADLGKEGSAFFKAVYVNPSRMAPQVVAHDVINSIE